MRHLATRRLLLTVTTSGLIFSFWSEQQTDRSPCWLHVPRWGDLLQLVGPGAYRPEEIASLVKQYGERVKPVTLEVRDGSAANAAVQLVVDTFGRLDVLVSNGGDGQFAPFEQMSPEAFEAVVDTCFYGVVFTTRAALSG